MRIVIIVPGTGGNFYCENCLRDAALVKALRAQNHDVLLVPMYLPIITEEGVLKDDSPIFFGGINTYLQQNAALFRRTPRWIDRLLDARWLLALAARRAGSVRAGGLGAMTLSMLRGEEGNQAKEVARLVSELRQMGPIDIVHLSNALLLGLAPALRRELGVRIVCSLQDENTWVDALEPPFAALCWQAIRERAAEVSAFTAVSRFYAERMRDRLSVAAGNLHVVHPGIDLTGYEPSLLPLDPPVIGYMARMSAPLGLETLVDACIRLRRGDTHRGLKLKITGGMTDDDKPFLRKLKRKIEQAGFADGVEFLPRFDRASRQEFLRTLTVLSVPQRDEEALGLFVLEALASGVPVLQPAIGGYPEIVEATGGGELFEPNTPESLATSLDKLLRDPERLSRLGRAGREAVQRSFGLPQVAERMLRVYEICA